MMGLLGLCICSFMLIVQVACGTDIRGVAPFELQFYKDDPFKCRNEPTKTIPHININDDYCDCADGSDEPGTSACATGQFYCINKGYKGFTIFSSQVNDGICDCCDGSDEYEGKVTCVNDCVIKGAALQKQREEEKQKIQKGLEVKNAWIAEAAKTLAEKKASVDAQKAEVEKLKKVVDDLEAEKKGFEEKERAEQDVINERKKELERIEQERLAKEAPPENEQKEEEALKELLNENQEENKEESPDAPPSEPHHEEPEPPYAEIPTPPPPSLPLPPPPSFPPSSPSSRFAQPRDRNKYRFGGKRQPGGERVEEEIPPAPPAKEIAPEEETELLKSIREGSTGVFSQLFETYQSCKNWLVSTLQRFHILSTEEESRLSFYEEGKRKIEDELSQVRRDLSSAEGTLRDTEDILKRDFGPNNEYFALNGNCYEYKTREYTYTVCPFGDVKQGHTSLGKFDKWDPAYSVMSFTDGQQCWGGPKRSARITLLCGAENELYDIQEPNKCEYSMKLNTPAACSADPLRILELGGEEGDEHGYFH